MLTNEITVESSGASEWLYDFYSETTFLKDYLNCLAFHLLSMTFLIFFQFLR